ncbi:hypothetical protein B0I37DRAFT_174570 [Chaetomium sp. MPI-CAGE-AT-0009]|nr:hypothetical protein B0I37DRAFT_174570 [Chaetomium sp. MPI-CAGE-AT-0009]
MERGALFFSFLFFLSREREILFQPRRISESWRQGNAFRIEVVHRPFILDAELGRGKRTRGRRLTPGRGGKAARREADSRWEERGEMTLHFGRGLAALVCYPHPLPEPSEEIFRPPKGGCREIDVLPQGQIKKNQPKPKPSYSFLTVRFVTFLSLFFFFFFFFCKV